MDAFEICNPVKLIFGPGTVARAGSEARTLGRRALVVSYQGSRSLAGLQAKVAALLEAAGVACVPFHGITANPLLSQVRTGIAACREANADLVIAIGGGSVMDAAKIIAAGVLYPGDPWDMIVSRHDQATARPPVEALPLLLIPTLPATASEMNCGAVVTNELTHEKSYVFATCLYPKVSIVDPELTCTLPPYQTACGAADAISHAMETYLNGVDGAPLQERMLEAVILTTMEGVRTVLKDPGDVQARADLQWAAILAWNGWLQAGINGWAPMHQFGHVFSARYDVAHGASLAITMPAYMRHVCHHRLERYVQMGRRIFGMAVDGREPAAVAAEVIDRFEAFLRSIGVPTRLGDARIPVADIDAMVDDIARISFGADGRLNSRPSMDRTGVRAVLELAV